MDYKLYEVGGKIRDEYLGLTSKDVDYSVVVQNPEQYSSPIEALQKFDTSLINQGYEIFVRTPECFTIRAMFPKDHEYSGVADFVMARKEVSYISGTRTPIVEIGSLEDDLRRRDFTVNTLAKDNEGNIIDLFGGVNDIRYKRLDTPIDPNLSFRDDPLRILRGIRFAVTKGFTFSKDVKLAIRELSISGMEVVSKDRIREELHKCLHFDTMKTLDYLNFIEKDLEFPIKSYIFDNSNMWLKPTNEK